MHFTSVNRTVNDHPPPISLISMTGWDQNTLNSHFCFFFYQCVCSACLSLCLLCCQLVSSVCVRGASYMLSVFPDRYLGTTCFHMWCWIDTPPTGLNTRAPDPLWDSLFPHSLSPDLEPQGCLAPPLGSAWSAGEEGGGFLALSLGPQWRNQLASGCIHPFCFAL